LADDQLYRLDGAILSSYGGVYNLLLVKL